MLLKSDQMTVTIGPMAQATAIRNYTNKSGSISAIVLECFDAVAVYDMTDIAVRNYEWKTIGISISAPAARSMAQKTIDLLANLDLSKADKTEFWHPNTVHYIDYVSAMRRMGDFFEDPTSATALTDFAQRANYEFCKRESARKVESISGTDRRPDPSSSR